MARRPPAPICAICSKPILSDMFVIYREGDQFHLSCLVGAGPLKRPPEDDPAETGPQPATDLVEEMERRRAGLAPKGPIATRSRCPLCREPATLTDWRPVAEWIVVERCPCSGYYLWAAMVGRVGALADQERQGLEERVRDFRKSGHEAWVATTNDEVTGPFVVRTSQQPA
jgi:hypothetical protein